ncbi:MAG TPA: hypothetical protein DEQ38_12340 [Elusimicrobia bacterium]|nr:MAG: hypothetical protein A2089_06405 [Elusimicrobia bacterium GWD2_63_28]HCC48888.1 hypothetical protein [Elusimicrobiota bacterium]
MADNSSNRRKTLIISVLAFLLAGGGIFLFFVIQGSNDLTGSGKKNTFSYGFAVREAVLPLFKRMGISTYEDELVDATKKRLEGRGIDLSADGAGAPDVSDWMAKADDAPSYSPSPSGRAPTPTPVPKMAGRAGSMPGGGGGGSKSAGGLSRFGEGSTSGNTSVSNKGAAGAGGKLEKGTMGALKNARALLGEGLKSGSAMTAHSKWGQSFGVGGTGGKSGDLAYNKAGLVGLDKIKSGDIADLKMSKPGSLNVGAPPDPTKNDKATEAAKAGSAESKEAMENKMKEAAAQAAIQAAEQAMSQTGSGTGTGTGTGTGPDDKANNPDGAPADILALGGNSKPPEGKFCPDGCPTGDGEGTYKDNEAKFQQCGSDWCVTYSGTQTGTDGTKFDYSDTMRIVPGGNPPFVPISSTANGNPVDFGAGP